MATIVERPPEVRPSPTTVSLTPALSLSNSSSGGFPIVPNKHIPVCPPGPTPLERPATPPQSPSTKQIPSLVDSLLYPPNRYSKVSTSPNVYVIDAEGLAAAIAHQSSQPLPDPKQLFPWLHGLHAENSVQLNFFAARRKAMRKVPKCLRGITIVKCGGDLSHSKLKGAISPDELLSTGDEDLPAFQEFDPKDGFSVRNFQIQAGKVALISDIVVYGDDKTPEKETLALGKKFAAAQKAWRERNDPSSRETLACNTFIVSSSFSEFEEDHPSLVAVDSQGYMTGHVMDFFHWERQEMCTMSRHSEIARNVWLGPTPDPNSDIQGQFGEDYVFDIMIEASDLAQLPDRKCLKRLMKVVYASDEALKMEFPSSGSIMPPGWSQSEADGLIDACRWIHQLADPEAASRRKDSDGDVQMGSSDVRPRRILIHCADGYTESSLLALAYFMYAESAPVHEAWLKLHCDKRRNFFAYPSDLALLTSIQPRLLEDGAKSMQMDPPTSPAWLSKMDGSLPNRILPYMYLGNLGHANNPELLRAMGIQRILSVGEPVSWSREEHERWGLGKLLYIDRVQDNGIDTLTEEFERCLEFIADGRREGTATLVHCRVGVSRSATICIAEVMQELGMSFPRAYCFVRARRLNVIIQPHVKFSYELLRWEELQRRRRQEPLTRELEWPTIAREIALMNRPYAR